MRCSTSFVVVVVVVVDVVVVVVVVVEAVPRSVPRAAGAERSREQEPHLDQPLAEPATPETGRRPASPLPLGAGVRWGRAWAEPRTAHGVPRPGPVPGLRPPAPFPPSPSCCC